MAMQWQNTRMGEETERRRETEEVGEKAEKCAESEEKLMKAEKRKVFGHI